MKSEIISTNKNIIDTAMQYQEAKTGKSGNFFVPGKNNKFLKKEQNSGLTLHSVVFFIDIRGSTIISKENASKNVGRIHKAFYNTVINCIEYFHGKVRSCDGDSVLAFFEEGTAANKCDNAISAAANINNLIKYDGDSLNKLLEKYDIELDFGIGIDMDNIQCVNIGNEVKKVFIDKKWVSQAINDSVKISKLCKEDTNIAISEKVHESTTIKIKDGEKIWNKVSETTGGITRKFYKASGLYFDTIE